MKKFIIAIVAMSVAIGASAQDSQYSVKAGDKVQVSRNCATYLTGEKIASWVYDEPQTILKVGGKRFPNGVLLAGICSWVSLEAVGAYKIEPQPQPQPEPVVVPQPQPEPEPVVPVVELKEEPQPVVQPEPVVEPEPVIEPEPEVFVRPAEHRFGIGVRAGLASLMQEMGEQAVNFKRELGGGAGIDLEYTYLSREIGGRCQLGVKTGVSLAFAGNRISADTMANTYNVLDSRSEQLTYNVNATVVRENNYKLMVEIPILFALRSKEGITFAFGPKINIPVCGWFKTTYQNSNIDVYFQREGVHEINEVVTGKLDGVAPTKNNQLRTSKLNLMLMAELGYEWSLSNGNTLGLMAYGEGPFAGDYMTGNGSEPIIQIEGPKAGGPDIYTGSMMNASGRWMSYFSAGIKVAYHFCFPKK